MLKLLSLSVLLLLSACASNGGENLTAEQKTNMALVKWHSNGLVKNHTGLSLLSIDGKGVGGGEYWVTAGEHDLKFACGRWESDKVVDGSTYSKGQRTVSFEAGETYFLAGKRTGSGRNIDVCSLHKFTYEEAKKRANSITAMFM
jgi:hypothetical protein